MKELFPSVFHYREPSVAARRCERIKGSLVPEQSRGKPSEYAATVCPVTKAGDLIESY